LVTATSSDVRSDDASLLPLGTVTFLFTDVEGSTQLLRRLGREEYAVVLEGQRELVRRRAAAESGVVVDAEGDGILVAFSSARAALAAAVTTQLALATARWGREHTSIRVRMGLDSGEVVRRAGAYIGVPLHRGARICRAGHGGQVLLSATTRALVGTELPEGVEVRDLGVVLLEGFAEPEQLFQITGAKLPGSDAAPRVRLRQTEKPILERQSEIAALDAVVAEAQAGSGSVVLVEGPAGIGKSALLEVARRHAEDAGLRLLGARGGELEVDYPFGVVRQLFEPVVARSPDAEALFAGAAALARHVVDAAAAALATNTDGYAILHGLYWLCASLSERAPLLVTVDDLHWCDAASLRFLAYLGPRVQELPIALLVTVRPGEEALDERAFRAITSDVAVRRIVPRPLSEEAVAALLLRTLAVEPEPAFVAACHRATSANPLLVHELVGALVEAGVKPTARSVDAIPRLGADAVSRFVLRRLDRLPSAARSIAITTAVLGEQTELGTVAELAQLERPVAADAAGALARADVLEPGPTLRFVHPLVRDAVYRALNPSEREQMHARAATLLLAGLESDVVTGSQLLKACAVHLLHAGPATVPGAAGMIRNAARLSLTEGDPAGAIAFLQRTLAEPLGPSERGQVLVELGAAELRVDPCSATAHLREALPLLDDPDGHDEAALLLGRALYSAGDSVQAAELLETVLEGRADPESDLSHRIEAELIGALLESLQRTRSDERLRNVNRQPGSGGLGGRMLRAHLSTQVTAGELSRNQSIELAAEAVGDDVLLEDDTSDVFMWAAGALMNAGEYGLAQSALDRALEWSSRRGSMQMFATASYFRARLFHDLGALADAEADARSSLAVLELHDLPGVRPWLASVLGDILLDRGQLDDAAAAVRIAPAVERAHEVGMLVLTRARLYLALGRPEEALVAIDEVGRRRGADSIATYAWRALEASALAALGRQEEALHLASEDVASARAWGAPRKLGHVLRVAGLLEGGSTGLDLLQEAVAVLKYSGARLEFARSLVELGAARRRYGRRADARDPLRKGLEVAVQCGADVLAARAHDELVAAGARPRRDPVESRSTLTASELRVARMAAEGLTNREIAQALFLTEKTIEVHLTRAYRKLEIQSRSQLARALPATAVPA
jgi:class 3 adenylate cyclase/DNA-binding CsgD family transcriptional regulator